MELQKEPREIAFRKETFTVLFHFWRCNDSGEQFTTSSLDEINLQQAYHQYRVAHKLPFPEEIQEIRAQYGISATKMSEVLGFGVNIYRQYEHGEVPSESNARLIQLARDPERFRSLIELCNTLGDNSRAKLQHRVDQLIQAQNEERLQPLLEKYLLGSPSPDEFSGYRRPNLRKFAAMIEAFSQATHPWKTKLNKLLFYADFLHFSLTCTSISGMRYDAIKFGPVPHNFQGIYQYLAQQQIIKIDYVEYDNGSIGERFGPVGNDLDDALTPEEMASIQKVIERFGTASSQDMIFVSHLESAWKDTVEAKIPAISYLKYGFQLGQLGAQHK